MWVVEKIIEIRAMLITLCEHQIGTQVRIKVSVSIHILGKIYDTVARSNVF
jgi:hypothetical protein